ncbi:MAG: N-acetylmuramic acid 6-phosphate etherase [Microbacteriaceae bacterium]|nr:N-acetylmuramic acid 6-phosphate etherase [Microbacteriaceae bacterium]
MNVAEADNLGEFATLRTEGVDPRFEHVDRMSVAELALLMNEADATVPAAVRAAMGSIIPAIEAASALVAAGGRLIYVGAGTPGRIGVLDASEAPPTFGTSPDRIFAIIAGGPTAIVNAVEGAEDDSAAGIAAIDAAAAGPGDVVIALASSGRTPFVVAAAARARERGALTVGMSCNEATPLSAVVEHPIEVLVGPELISGSTRLKAGTAQKLVLNMFSTISMIRAGKTYGNLMIDVRPTNEKLRERATRIVQTVSGSGHADAAAALAATGFEVKPAIVMLSLGVSAAEAASIVAREGGTLRSILEGAQS